ncbi:MAG: radical SAM protein [Phycisphaerales bacterium]|nr:MAG: radical SAM protein [Phycisphaerales bacterium]
MPKGRTAYLDPDVRASLPERVDRARKELEDCRACPRNCGINRLEGETKFCNVGRHALVSSAFPHLGEEDCLRGWRGSGTIFFAGCNLRCVFCQNADISQKVSGQPLDATAIAAVMLELEARGCHNINFVTPEHVVPQVVEALALAIDAGLTLPVVYNTSAYDAVESLKLMDGLVDIYMPDFKFWDSESAKRLCKAKDYPHRARDAIGEMHRQVGDLHFTTDGLACRGVLIRHLVMPGQLDQSIAIFRWLSEEISPDTFVNIMPQYRPAHEVGFDERYSDINRPPTPVEIAAAHEAARAAGLWRFDERRV